MPECCGRQRPGHRSEAVRANQDVRLRDPVTASRDGLYKRYRHVTLWKNAFWAGKTVGAVRK